MMVAEISIHDGDPADNKYDADYRKYCCSFSYSSVVFIPLPFTSPHFIPCFQLVHERRLLLTELETCYQTPDNNNNNNNEHISRVLFHVKHAQLR